MNENQINQNRYLTKDELLTLSKYFSLELRRLNSLFKPSLKRIKQKINNKK